MLIRYRFRLDQDHPCRSRPEWAYRLYAALLERAPDTFSNQVHSGNISPVSQYLDLQDGQLIWSVTALGETAIAALGPLLESPSPFYLERDQLLLTPTPIEQSSLGSVEELLFRAARGGDRHRLEIRTAAAFKSRGQYQTTPTSRLIIQNLITRWNACVPDCPIEDEDGEGLEALADGVCCQRLFLRDRRYYLKGHPVPGFTGRLVLENRLAGFSRELVNALLIFSGFAGVGIKTTLGMGGTIHTVMR